MFAKIPIDDAIDNRMPTIWRTLRNGFTHFNWHYEDLSATEYWNAQRWSLKGAPPAFDLKNRVASNFTAYIADSQGRWEPNDFWSMKELRILVTRYPTLRYHLHRFLNLLLNSNSCDVFKLEPREQVYLKPQAPTVGQ